MRIARLKIQNFRGIESSEILLPTHAVLVGDNNSGKSTVFEAIDLVLGPERLSRHPVVDEHDFFGGKYLTSDSVPIEIKIETTIVDMTDEQIRHFKDHLEWWNNSTNGLLDGPPPEGTDAVDVIPALRVEFVGMYDADEDDFRGYTSFVSPTPETGEPTYFKAADKRICGFLYLRTLRTGSRALSLERGSLLDIILRLQEKRFNVWEDVLKQLRKLPVAENPELGVSDILVEVQKSLRTLVPSDWADNPRIKVSDLTRETLRRTLTVFMSTGAKDGDGEEYSAPFNHQGTGTINTLVLSLLSFIAELKQNVIFAMEEPETAIPPHTQRRIIDSVRGKSAQALFTSHSPYVLQEFPPDQVLILHRSEGILEAKSATYPPAVKPKAYRASIRARFCEAILARRILITEGRTEYDAFPTAARRLHELFPGTHKTLEALGVAVLDAETESQVTPLGEHFTKLGKTVFAVFDKQAADKKAAIEAAVKHPYESPESNFEDLVLNGTVEAALRRFGIALVDDGGWPSHLSHLTPKSDSSIEDLREGLRQYFKHSKGSGGAADLLYQCGRDEMPKFIVETLEDIQRTIETSQKTQPVVAASSPASEISEESTEGEQSEA